VNKSLAPRFNIKVRGTGTLGSLLQKPFSPATVSPPSTIPTKKRKKFSKTITMSSNGNYIFNIALGITLHLVGGEWRAGAMIQWGCKACIVSKFVTKSLDSIAIKTK